MNDKTGFYAVVTNDKECLQLGFSIGYNKILKDFCIWARLFTIDIYIGYQSKTMENYYE